MFGVYYICFVNQIRFELQPNEVYCRISLVVKSRIKVGAKISFKVHTVPQIGLNLLISVDPEFGAKSQIRPVVKSRSKIAQYPADLQLYLVY